MRRRLLVPALVFGSLALAHSCKKDSPAPSAGSGEGQQSKDAGRPQQPVGLSGNAVRQGTSVPFDSDHVAWKATSCREDDVPLVTVHVYIPAEKSTMHVDETVMDLSIDPDKVFLGKKGDLPTQSEFQAGQEDHEKAVRALIWVSPAGRPAISRLPYGGWAKVDKVSRKGQVDITFNVDFGEDLGHAEGRLTFEQPTVDTCVMPTPPRP